MRLQSVVVASFLAAGITVPAIAFHNHLTKSAPAANEVLAESPKTIRLWFSEKVEPKFSSIVLMRADSTKLEVGKAAATDDPKSIAADLATPLSSGKYLIRWRTAGDDGHAVRGTFSFSVK
jgi:methionine-rich copper-binding protein CopC